MNNEPKFSELKKGDKAEIIGYNTGDSQYKSKLLSMGLVRGVVARRPGRGERAFVQAFAP